MRAGPTAGPHSSSALGLLIRLIHRVGRNAMAKLWSVVQMLAPAVVLFAVVSILAALGSVLDWGPEFGARTAAATFDILGDSEEVRQDTLIAVEEIATLADIGAPKRLVVHRDRILAAGNQQVTVMNSRGGEAYNLFGKRVPAASPFRTSIRSIDCYDDECWLVGYYGIVSKWRLSADQDQPSRVGFAGHGLLGGFWSESGQLVTNKADSRALLSEYQWSAESRAEVELARGACCDGVPIQLMREMRSHVEPPIANVHRDLAHYVNRTSLTTDNRGWMALAFLMDSRIYLFDSQRRPIASVAGPEYLRMDFAVGRFRDTGNALFRPAPDTRFGYLDVAANEHIVAALYAGRRFGQYGLEGVHAGEYVDVFDWGGELKGRYRLPCSLRLIAVAPSSRQLFGLTDDSPPRLITATFPISSLGMSREGAIPGK